MDGRNVTNMWPEGFDQVLRNLQRFSGLVVMLLVALWLGSGTYQVAADEVGVVQRFGRVVEQTQPGLHWRLPWPIETVDLVRVQSVHRIEVGFRTVDKGPPARYQVVPEESLMLTGDENIVHAEVIVQYRIKDPRNYLFNVRDPDAAVRAALEASLRGVVGSRPIDGVLTAGKAEVQAETLSILQNLLDLYESGVQAVNVQLQDVQPPEQVAKSFKDVASAREEREKLKNEAQSYQNEILPKARGEAEQILQEAESFKAEQISRSQGEANRFLAILQEYRQGKEVNRKRLYLEAMEAVLGQAEIVIIDDKTSGVVPYLPLGRSEKGGVQQ